MMVKAPGLTAVLAITLALGIGASTTIFSVVNSVVLRPLPYEQPDQLVRVYTNFLGKLQLKSFWLSVPEFDDLQKQCRSCAAVGGWARGSASLSGGDRPVRIQAAYASHTLLPLLGVQPVLGRTFDASEDRPGDPTVVVLGYDVWQRAFGGSRDVVGKQIHLDAMPVTVIGVMPKGFDFLDGEEAWVPANWDLSKSNRGSHFVNTVVRLKPGVTIQQFRAELASLEKAWGALKAPKMHAIDPVGHPMQAEPFQADLVGSLASTLWLLQGAVLFVLLISIVNVANLLIARADTRSREIAVRHALGANRRRLMRQFITESVILGLLGGALGVLVAVWAVDGVTALIPKSAPRASEITLDGMAVAFAVACSIVASLLFGIAPIVHARKTDLHGALKDGSPRMTGSKARLRLRRALVTTEIALAVMLVVGCTVMIRSFIRIQHVDLGFSPDRTLTFGIELPQKTYPNVTGDQFWDRLEARMKALPGVTGVTMLDTMLPTRPLNANDFELPNRTKPNKDQAPWNVDYFQLINAGGFEAMGARIVKGRGIEAQDVMGAPAVVVINEAFAKKFFPHEEPLGQQIQVTYFKDPNKIVLNTVVGVVHDIKNAGVDKPAGTELFTARAQYAQLNDPMTSDNIQYVMLRTTGDPGELIPSVYRVVADLDPRLPLFQVRTMDDLMWDAVARPRFLTFLLSCFAGIALLLAAVGIYGVMAHTVAQRTHEIGLRVALGAQPAHVRAMVVRQAASLVAMGVAVGLAAAVVLEQVLTSSLRGLFYGEQLSQPVLLVAVAIAVAATALLATWLPVKRATSVQPIVALRSE
ncbi:MAG: ABC transporter permease [Deltaproteobacteria bacterium]|nr:ABC transporter permease [Deltaproteobacteria bacterium]